MMKTSNSGLGRSPSAGDFSQQERISTLNMNPIDLQPKQIKREPTNQSQRFDIDFTESAIFIRTPLGKQMNSCHVYKYHPYKPQHMSKRICTSFTLHFRTLSTIENLHPGKLTAATLKHGGLVQMIFLFNVGDL